VSAAPESGLSPDVPIVLAASAGWETAAPVNVHQIARRLAARGHRVLFVESTGLRPPASAGRDWRRVGERVAGFARGVREVEPNLSVLSPVVPPMARRTREYGLRALSWLVARAVRRAGLERPVLWAFLPTHAVLAERLACRAVVYHCVDHYAANPGVDDAWVDGLEARLIARADLVLATSPVLAERLRARGAPVVLAPNVADVALFAGARERAAPEPPELQGLARPRFVYAGNLAAYRIDFELLLALARARPEASLVLVGAMGLGDVGSLPDAARALRTLPNVHWRAPLAQEALPALLAHCDVALIPFLDNAHTRGSLPLKLWEYVAAGLPVVGRELPNLVGHAEPGVLRLAADPGSFVAACDASLPDSDALRALRRERAAPHDWPVRMDQLLGAVGRAIEPCAGARRVGAP